MGEILSVITGKKSVAAKESSNRLQRWNVSSVKVVLQLVKEFDAFAEDRGVGGRADQCNGVVLLDEIGDHSMCKQPIDQA